MLRPTPSRRPSATPIPGHATRAPRGRGGPSVGLSVTGSLAVSALVAMTLLGCPSLGPGREPPEVSLVDLRPLPSEPFEQRFAVELRIVNPNAEPLRAEGVDVVLDVNERRLGRALSDASFTVPRLGEETITLVATTNLIDLFQQIIALPTAAESGRLDYALRGRILLSGSDRWLRFSREGSLVPSNTRPGPPADRR